jgi:hypothetical protein
MGSGIFVVPPVTSQGGYVGVEVCSMAGRVGPVARPYYGW